MEVRLFNEKIALAGPTLKNKIVIFIFCKNIKIDFELNEDMI